MSLEESDKREKRFLESKGSACPRCGDHEINLGDRMIDASGVSLDMHCNECGYEWSALYTLTGMLEKLPEQ